MPHKSREFWQNLVEAGLPNRDAVLERNAAITARYATWYLAEPTIYHWSGIAAFASHRVGLALLPYYLDLADSSEQRRAKDSSSDASKLLRDLELIRETNNAIFNNIGWAHAAFISGGIQEIEAALAGSNDVFLLLGFKALDQARSAYTRGDLKAWRSHLDFGTLELLRQEQQTVVQPNFDKLDATFDLFLSIATRMDYYVNALEFAGRFGTWFIVYIWTRGLVVVIRSLKPPNICTFQHRWSWIEHAVLPLWRHFISNDPDRSEKLRALSRGGATGAFLAKSQQLHEQ